MTRTIAITYTPESLADVDPETYREALTAELLAHYPGARIEIDAGGDAGIAVRGIDESDIDEIRQIDEDVFAELCA